MSAERSPSLCQLRNVLSSTKASNKVGFQSPFLWLSRQENLLLESIPLCDSKRGMPFFFFIVQHFQFLCTYKGKMAQPVNSQGANE